MSREPTSSAHRLAHFGTPAIQPPAPPAPKPTQPKPHKPRFRVFVEPAKPKPTPTVSSLRERRRQSALSKMATTTEALTSDERALLRELRARGPSTVSRTVAAIEEVKRQKGLS